MSYTGFKNHNKYIKGSFWEKDIMRHVTDYAWLRTEWEFAAEGVIHKDDMTWEDIDSHIESRSWVHNMERESN